MMRCDSKLFWGYLFGRNFDLYAKITFQLQLDGQMLPSNYCVLSKVVGESIEIIEGWLWLRNEMG